MRERVRGVDESNVDEIYTVHQRRVYVFSIRNKRLRVCERAFEAFRTFSGSLLHLPEGWVSNDGTRTSSIVHYTVFWSCVVAAIVFHASPESIIKLNC